MAVSVICKLLHGKDTLDLNSGRYCLDDGDFMPPTTARAVTYGSLLAGAEPVRKRRENRAWSFSVNVAGTTASKSEAERALRNLQSFLNRAGGATPLYVAYRNFSDYDYEPFFGQFGAFSRYEVVHGTAEVTQQYNAPLGNSSVIARIRVDLVIKPQAVGLQQQSGQATGGVFEDYTGSVTGMVKGTRVAEAATNKFTNPVFGNGTFSTNWSATTLLVSENKDPDFILFGDTSVRIRASSSAGRYTESLNVGNTNTHVLSFYIKMEDGSSPAGSVFAYYGGSNGVTATAIGDGWYHCWASVTGVAAGTETGVQVSNNLTSAAYIDGFQIEERAYPTPLVYGDLLDCSWSGTKHASTSTRTDSRIRYNFNDILGLLGDFTIRVVWTPMAADLTDDTYIFDDTDSHLSAWLDSSQRYNFQTSAASSVQSAAVTLTPGTPEVLHFVYDSTRTAKVYRNGASLVSGGTTEDTVAPTFLYIGSNASARQHLNWTINGVATFRRAMSAAAVLADYTQAIQQVTDGDRIDPLPWVFSEDGDNVIDNDNDGTLFNYAIVGGLVGDDVDVAYKLDSSNSFVLGQGVTWGALPVDPRIFDKDILTSGTTNTLLFVNGEGTADVTANGDEVKRISLGTSSTTLLNTAISEAAALMLADAKNVTGYFVAKDANTRTNVMVRLAVDFGGANESFVTDWRTLATSNAFRPFVTFDLPLDLENYILNSNRIMGFRIDVKRAAGASTENFDVSHAIWLINYAGVFTGDVTASPVLDMAYGREQVLELVDDANPTQTRGRRIFNRPLLIKPERLNVLMLQHTFDNFAASKSTWATGYNLEIEQFAVTPRFDIF